MMGTINGHLGGNGYDNTFVSRDFSVQGSYEIMLVTPAVTTACHFVGIAGFNVGILRPTSNTSTGQLLVTCWYVTYDQ